MPLGCSIRAGEVFTKCLEFEAYFKDPPFKNATGLD
jgi:hypothetical protein